MAAYGFSENDAKRIGKVVRLVERGPDKIRLGGPEHVGPVPGVRLLIAKHAGSSWSAQSTAVVTVFNGAPGSVASAVTLVAYNHYVKFGVNSNCTNRWVALGHNGFAWHPVHFSQDCQTCVSEISGISLGEFPYYTAGSVQMLGHDGNGCLKWFDVTTCATAA